MEWWNKEFNDICEDNNVEPILTGDGVLVLNCSRVPSEEVLSQIRSMIPDSQRVGIAEGLRSITRQVIAAYLVYFNIEELLFTFHPEHQVILDVKGDAGNQVFEKDSDLWKQIRIVLKMDPFTESFLIRFNGQTMLEESAEDKTEDFELDKSMLVSNDNRFSYDRDYLPTDASTDIKILLESTGSVEEFLKHI